MNDWELIERFVTGRDEVAFADLVRRHGSFVLASARRQIGSELAEDVMQAVFLVLARKAPSLDPKVVLSSWLFRTTGYVVAQVRRREARRIRREQEASLMMQDTGRSEDPDELRERLEQHIDAALSALSALDRGYVLSRFVEGKKFEDIGEQFGVSEDAAKKRVLRALDRIRGFLEGRGVVLSTAVLGGFLAAPQAEALPPHLPERIANSICVRAGPGSGGRIANLAENALRDWTRARWSRFCVRLGLVGGTAAALVSTAISWPPPRTAFSTRDDSPAARPSSVSLASAWRRVDSSQRSVPAALMTLTLLNDATGEPVAGARVGVTRSPTPQPLESREYWSGSGGVCEVPLDRRPDEFTKLWVRASGFMPVHLGWTGYVLDSDQLSYTCRLIPARRFSGEIRGPQGEPIAGASVEFGADAQRNRRTYEQGNFHYSVTTDAEGKFFTDEFPRFSRVLNSPWENGETSRNLIQITVTAAGYVPHGWILTNTMALPDPWVAHLKRGETFRGLVTDEADAPIAGAKVFVENRLGTHEGWASPDSGVVTDSLGKFAHPHVDADGDFGLNFFVRAAGYSPWEGRVRRHPLDSLSPVERGNPPQVLPQGTNGWFAAQDASNRRPALIELVDPAKAGLDSILVKVQLSPEPRENGGNGAEIAGESPVATPTHVVGTVVDSGSGLPIQQFRVLLDAPGYAKDWFLGEGHGGVFDWILPKHYPKTMGLEVAADGHLVAGPTRSEETKDGRVMLFELRSANEVVGRIESPAGAAVVAARVALANDDTYFGWTDEGGWTVVKCVGTETRSGNDGEFHLKPTGREKAILVLHSNGCALEPLDMGINPILRLSPWSKVEGILTEGNLPIAGAEVRLSTNVTTPESKPQPYRFAQVTKTDARGRFCFARVPPGPCLVSDGQTFAVVSTTHGDPPLVRLRRNE